MEDKYSGKMLDDRYELLEPIGYGGMAVVYKALCHRLNRLVAVKILKEEYSSDADFKRRFETESRAVAMLSHPNIVSVYDVNRSEGLEYIVMELIDGMTLKDYMVKRGKLGWRETLHFSTLIAKALEHAHSRGVIHRDIKPHNIMVLRDGSVKVADFGIARFTSAQHTLTQEALGSVHYISPEQARGSQLDARTDLYSLGVVMYEMLTGRLPYDGESPVAVAIAHINSKPIPPHELADDIPTGLEYIAMKAMTADMSKRYASATDMLVDLEEFRKNPSIDFTAPQKTAVTPAPVKVVSSAAHKSQDKKPASQERKSVDNKPKQSKEPKTTGKKPGKKPSKIPLIAGLLCVLIFIVGIGYFVYSYFLKDLISQNATVMVPTFIGESYDSIIASDYPGLEIELSATVSDENYQEGYVVDQSPSSGTRVKLGSTVKLTVSTGEPTDIMPNVVNSQQQVAFMTLDTLKVKIDVKIVTEYSDFVEGYVIRSDPESGETVKNGDTVTLVVSLGPQETYKLVPTLTGLTEEEAINSIESSGFSVGEIKKFEYDMPEGMVYYQSIDAGTSAISGTSINLYVSLGMTEKEQEPEESDPPLEITDPTEEPQEYAPEAIEPEESEPEGSVMPIVIRLPQDRETVTVTVKLDGEVKYQNTVSCSDETLLVELTGSGQQTLEIFFDNNFSVAEYTNIVDFG